MADTQCPKCGSEHITCETRPLQVAKPIPLPVWLALLGGVLVLLIGSRALLSWVAPAALTGGDLVRFMHVLGVGAVTVVSGIWYGLTRRARTQYHYHCATCGRRWSNLGDDAVTADEVSRMIWAYVALVGAVLVLASLIAFVR